MLFSTERLLTLTLCYMCQAFVKPEDRADPKRVYHMMTVDEVQTFFGSVVCAL